MPWTRASTIDRRVGRAWLRVACWTLLAGALAGLYRDEGHVHAVPAAGVSFTLPWSLDAWRISTVPLPGELPGEARGVIFRASPLGGLARIRLRTISLERGQSLEDYAAYREHERREAAGRYRLFHRAPTRVARDFDFTFARYPGMRYLKELGISLAGVTVRHYQYDVYFRVASAYYQATYLVPVILFPYYEADYRWIMGSITFEAGAGR
ncbi:MAG TPA: hypothetical protein DEQ28_01660 [Clostridiales bacterium]|nr:hypothetical protein [Clostridiales bacterium]